MNIRQELKAMSERIFADTFQAFIGKHLVERKSDDYYAEIEGHYEKAKLGLKDILSEADSRELEVLEAKLHEQQTATGQYGFYCGLYAGFEQIFKQDGFVENSFRRLVVDRLLTKPAMIQHIDYNKRSDECVGVFTRMTEELGDDIAEHMTSIEVAWDERIYGAATISFYCGYRAAMAVQEQISPLPDSKVLKNILLTEYELGLTLPLSQRELHNA